MFLTGKSFFYLRKLNKIAQLKYFNNVELGFGNKSIEMWCNASLILLISTVSAVILWKGFTLEK